MIRRSRTHNDRLLDDPAACEAMSRAHQEAFPRDKPRWRESQRNMPIADKVALLGQTILETLEFEKIKKHAKSL